ncbi:hypothetical protein KC19_8G150500 [Ceratodon purpureus]|uniref:Bromo domain-containing protein n=1 Tax=Ceratodon purpureus TaxID=3225 RepID=A0A8T0H3L5_CERPU|nr:hypothetical protein KC19_8G150500 [Ceratodon purpureus]
MIVCGSGDGVGVGVRGVADMAEHEVAGVPQEQAGTSGAAEAAACWGTCEELLLVSAVKRHGVNNWSLIASELKARAITLNVSPLYFSETACKQKYDVLRGRFASCSSSTMSQDEDVGNDMHWFEELRKIRVAHLKRELEHYDGSIGSLQVKIKRLKAEKAGDIAAIKQLGKSIANSQPNDQVPEDNQLGKNITKPKQNDQVREVSTCEVPVQCSPIDDEIGKDLSKSFNLKLCSQASLALNTEKSVHDNAFIQDPVNLQHVNPECDQWHDAVGDLQGVSSGPTDITMNADAHRDNTRESRNLDRRVEQHDGTMSVTVEPNVPSGGGVDELQAVEAAGVATVSEVDEDVKIPEKGEQADIVQGTHLVDRSAESLSRDHEAGLLVLDSGNEDKLKAGVDGLNTVEQGIQELVRDECTSIQPDRKPGGDKTSSAAADTISNLDTCENGGTVQPIHPDLRAHAEGHSIPSPSSSLLCPESSGSMNLGEAGDKQPETPTISEEKAASLNPQQSADELQKETLENIVGTPSPQKENDAEASLCAQSHAGRPLDTDHDDNTGQISSEHDSLGDAQGSHQIDKSLSNLAQDAKADEITSSEPVSEISKLQEDVPDSQVSKEVSMSGLDSAETGPESNTAAAEGVTTSQDDHTIVLEKPESEESSKASGLLHPLSAELKSSSPERHIVIALDEPNDNIPSRGSKSTSASKETVMKVDMYIGSDAVSGVEAESMEGKEQAVETSCEDVTSGECDPQEKSTAHVSSANAMDLLKEEYGALPSKGSELPLISVEFVQKPEPEKTAATSDLSLPSGMEASNLTNYGPARSDPVDNDMQMVETTSKVVDEPRTSELDVKTDLGQVAQDLEVGHNVEGVEHIDSHAAIAAVLPTPGSLPVGHTESDPAIKFGRDLPEFQVASIVRERKLQGIILDVKLEISKEESLDGQTSASRQQLSEVISEGSRGRDLDISSVSSPDAAEGRDHSDRDLIMESNESKPLTISPAKVKEEIIEYVRDRNLQEIMDSAPKSSIKLKAEPNSPVESLGGGLESKIPSSHEGSDSVQERYKDGGDHSGEREERRQRLRDYGESQIDKSEAGSPADGHDGMSPSSRRNRREPRVPGKLVPLLEVLRNICNHKSAYLFKGRPEDPRYNLLIRRHMDLTNVRARLEEGVYSGSSEFFRDLLLIFNNAMVFNPSGSTEFVGAKALLTEATKELNRISQTEALLKRDGPATRTRELKKPKTAVAVVAPPKVVTPSPIVGTSSGKLMVSNPSATSLPDTATRKRPSTRSGALETSTNSGAVVDSEGGTARSASVNIIAGPSTSRAEETRDSRDDDQEVNGSLKGGKKLHVGGGSSRGTTRSHEELQEGTSLKIGVSKASGRPKLRDLKDASEVAKRPAVSAKAAGAGKLKAERENERKREKERELKEKEKLKVSERDDIDDDDFLLRKGKSLAKLKDQEIIQERVSVAKPASKARASTAAVRSASNSQDTPTLSLARPVRGAARKAAAASSAKETARVPEQQPKKRVRK